MTREDEVDFRLVEEVDAHTSSGSRRAGRIWNVRVEAEHDVAGYLELLDPACHRPKFGDDGNLHVHIRRVLDKDPHSRDAIGQVGDVYGTQNRRRLPERKMRELHLNNAVRQLLSNLGQDLGLDYVVRHLVHLGPEMGQSMVNPCEVLDRVLLNGRIRRSFPSFEGIGMQNRHLVIQGLRCCIRRLAASMTHGSTAFPPGVQEAGRLCPTLET
mmetsp:Transcript_31010/g.67766  ORF Transcript_31010/g.67766 Transcript_31010/m.67766 type:complete len:213 (+) Transcript_31010:1257-1895(+)